MQEVRLSEVGRLWAWTAVTAAPPGYEGPVPYGFGIVELEAEALRVVGRLTEPDPSRLAAGQPMRVVVERLPGDLDMWAFAPEACDADMTGVEIVGVGLHPFGRFEDATATSMGVTALRAALDDAGWSVADARAQVGAAFCASAYGGVAAGHRVLGGLALTGMPIVDVEAGCASGGAALSLAASVDPFGRARRGDRRRHREDAQGDHPVVVLRAVAGAGRPRRDARLLRAAGAAHDGRPRADQGRPRRAGGQEPGVG